MEDSLSEKAKRIKLLILDVDGVLTDGRIVYDSKGGDLKFFDVKDGLGVYLLKRAGVPTVIVSARGSDTIRYRAKDMQVEDIYEDVENKKEILDKILKKYGIELEEICFVGDDLVDLSIMKEVGLSVAVKNACPEVKKISHYVTKREGGRGAVREISEIILKAKGKWEELISLYS